MADDGAHDRDERRPLASVLLMAYNQQSSVRAAIEGALAQTYQPLEIIVSDDASTDGTFEAMRQAVADYRGPHTVRLNRNPANLGIGAHISRLVALSHGEMLFVAAGDDVSLPQRCEQVMQAWLAQDQRPDLIAAAMIDIDADGRRHGTIQPSDLSRYRSAADWLARPPHVIGAAQAWTRRLFDRYGPLPSGVVGEDLIMVFRAIGSGGALTLDEPLVLYRRGGVSRRVRHLRAEDVVKRLLKSNRAALVELPQLLADARTMGQLPSVEAALMARLARERFVAELFDAGASMTAKLRIVLGASGVAWSTRLRLGLYAICPGALAPFFYLKRALMARERLDA
jgi:glycosyltransferase involved in cell wall biosynthesis